MNFRRSLPRRSSVGVEEEWVSPDDLRDVGSFRRLLERDRVRARRVTRLEDDVCASANGPPSITSSREVASGATWTISLLRRFCQLKTTSVI